MSVASSSHEETSAPARAGERAAWTRRTCGSGSGDLVGGRCTDRDGGVELAEGDDRGGVLALHRHVLGGLERPALVIDIQLDGEGDDHGTEQWLAHRRVL